MIPGKPAPGCAWLSVSKNRTCTPRRRRRSTSASATTSSPPRSRYRLCSTRTRIITPSGRSTNGALHHALADGDRLQRLAGRTGDVQIARHAGFQPQVVAAEIFDRCRRIFVRIADQLVLIGARSQRNSFAAGDHGAQKMVANETVLISVPWHGAVVAHHNAGAALLEIRTADHRGVAGDVDARGAVGAI